MASANTECSTSNEKSLSEWPALSDVCGNNRQKDPASEGPMSSNSAVRNRKNRRLQKPRKNSGGYDSAKENEDLPQSVNDCGTKKKSSQKKSWTLMAIEPPPYRRRGNGRQFNANRGARNDGRGNFHENERGNFRGSNNRRGRRGRETSQYQHYQPEETSVDGQSQVVSHEPHFATAVNINNTVYYNTYVYNAVQPQQKEPTLHDAIRYQVEYYFSEMNLLTDRYLRLHMDKQGFVDVALIANFHRLKRICSDVNVIIEALKDSSKLELSDDGKVRPVVNPLSWVLHEGTPGYFDPYFRKVIFPAVNMADLNLNGDSNPEAFNSYSMNSEMAAVAAAVSGYHPVPVNCGHNMNIHFNPETYKQFYLNGEPDIDGNSRQSPLNSNELEVHTKMFDKMDINGDASGNTAIYGPSNINSDASNSSAMCDPVGTNNDVPEDNAISLKKESISGVSGPSSFTVDSSRCDNKNVNGDTSSNFTALELVDVNCNTSRHVSVFADSGCEADKLKLATKENVTFFPFSVKKDSSVPDTVTLNSNKSIDDVSKQNSLNSNCVKDNNSTLNGDSTTDGVSKHESSDLNFKDDNSTLNGDSSTDGVSKHNSLNLNCVKDNSSTVNGDRSTGGASKHSSLNLNCVKDNSQHDTRKLNAEAEQLLFALVIDFAQEGKDRNEKMASEVSSCNSLPELMLMKS